MPTVSLSGFKELDQALGELPKATAKNVLKRTLMKAGQPIEDKAQQLAPRGATGKLERSIVEGTQLTRSQKRELGGGAVLTADGYRSASKNAVEVYVGTAMPRGQFMEFGTFKDHPEPFLGPAWEQEKDHALEIIESELGNEIEKAAARLARKQAKAAGI